VQLTDPVQERGEAGQKKRSTLSSSGTRRLPEEAAARNRCNLLAVEVDVRDRRRGDELVRDSGLPIKHYREITGCSLKDAKDAVDVLRKQSRD